MAAGLRQLRRMALRATAASDVPNPTWGVTNYRPHPRRTPSPVNLVVDCRICDRAAAFGGSAFDRSGDFGGTSQRCSGTSVASSATGAEGSGNSVNLLDGCGGVTSGSGQPPAAPERLFLAAASAIAPEQSPIWLQGKPFGGASNDRQVEGCGAS
jgi:hypothetical protein